MADSQKVQNGIIEACMWQLLEKQDRSIDAFFFNSLPPDTDGFSDLLKPKLGEDLCEQLPSDLRDPASPRLVEEIDECTAGMGVMLYFGSTTPSSLLTHVALALQTTHHKGSVILHLSNSLDLFQSSAIFLLYLLFDSVAVIKPYASDFGEHDRLVVA